MIRKSVLVLTNLLLLSFPLLAQSTDRPDLAMQSRIRQEGFRNSKVMEMAASLTDTIGPRLTGSPSMKRANEWTRDKLAGFGLANAHLEGFDFGRGWTSELTTVRMTAGGETTQLYAIAKAWSPATNGAIRGKVVRVKLETADDLEKNKGKLAGAIVMIADARELKAHDKAAFERYTDDELETLAQYEVPAARDARTQEWLKRRKFRRQLAEFAMAEKLAAVIDIGDKDGGAFRVGAGGTWKSDEPLGVPSVVLAAEHYNRIARLLEAGTEVEVELDLRARFHDGDLQSYNTIAEIAGSDRKGEVVMLGAHLDSWHASTGATDNAAGVAVMMEAMRILKAIGATPRRTIRIALWSGEEQGLLGSRAYVAQHFGSWPVPSDPQERDLPRSLRKDKGQLTTKPEHAKLAAYFNLDNGTGKIRGIYAQENAAAAPIFEAWLAPLKDLGATTITMRNTGSTDHIPFDEVGLPGFQFIQDEVEYSSLTHHTNWDSYERLQRDDLMQAAVVVATFVWETANRPELLPRKVVR